MTSRITCPFTFTRHGRLGVHSPCPFLVLVKVQIVISYGYIHYINVISTEALIRPRNIILRDEVR